MKKINQTFNDTNNNSRNNKTDDDDDDSLGSALSDYNGAFYDAQAVSLDSKKNLKENLLNGQKKDSDSLDDSFEEAKSEEDDNDDEDDCSMNNLNDQTPINDQFEIDNDEEIDAEFENYLNDDCNIDIQESDNPVIYSKIKKLQEIEYSIKNLEEFRLLAIQKYGFVNKYFRRKAWPLLILAQNSDVKQDEDLRELYNKLSVDYKQITENQVKKQRFFNQVTLDVIRTLKRFPPEISDKLRNKLQNQLIDVICKILVKHNILNYYQGYHDICLTFLLVNGVEESLPLLDNITLSHLTCFMELTMESTLKLLFNIMPLIDKLNPKVAEHLQRAELGVIFSLSWLITWYSHVMDNIKIILRLYDFFLATDPLMPIYLGAIIVCDKSDEILSIDCDMASLHTVITKYPSKLNDIEQLEDYILKSLKLYEQYPTKSLVELNEKWLKKCDELTNENFLNYKHQEEEEKNNLRQRSKQNNKKKYDNEINNNNNKIAKKNIGLLSPKKFSNTKLFANKFVVGLTFTVGVAAVAMYALNNNLKDSPDIISKFYQFLS